jgi:hypothetical protein
MRGKGIQVTAHTLDQPQKNVMAGLVPAIHEHGPLASGKWMAATRAAMTIFLSDNEGFSILVVTLGRG